jgi:hypothetical protein
MAIRQGSLSLSEMGSQSMSNAKIGKLISLILLVVLYLLILIRFGGF